MGAVKVITSIPGQLVAAPGLPVADTYYWKVKVTVDKPANFLGYLLFGDLAPLQGATVSAEAMNTSFSVTLATGSGTVGVSGQVIIQKQVSQAVYNSIVNSKVTISAPGYVTQKLFRAVSETVAGTVHTKTTDLGTIVMAAN